ncbi:MAG TPA: aromatic-ring-hydroxylating dioxygenase subunit beta [Burkholderiales bacterium]|jgi:anthranilate 1,2-dioxygenase small subunit
MAEYAMAIDDNRLEDWVELFDEACDYKVVTRENVEQGLPNILMWCDNKNMLRDRVESYRHVNLYNLHYDRHVIGPLRFVKQDGPVWTFDVSYSLFQTELEGASRLFSVGRYRVEAITAGDAARLKSVLVIADTGLVPSLLATPI